MATRTTKRNSVYFGGCKDITELRAMFISLMGKYSADADKLLEISNEYDALFDKYLKDFNKGKEKWQKVKEDPQKMREVVTKLMSYEDKEKDLVFKRDCKIVVSDNWLWISAADGKDPAITKNYSDILNFTTGVGCKWSNPKKAWYWFANIKNQKRKFYRQTWTMEQIYKVHGERVVQSADEI